MKIFVSYSRQDGKAFADHIYKYFKDLGEDVFTDTQNIRYGSKWKNELKSSISHCDIFVVICTPHSMRSSEIQKEVEMAKNSDKRIIPCVFTDAIDMNDLSWDLGDYQGVEFVDAQQLGLRVSKL